MKVIIYARNSPTRIKKHAEEVGKEGESLAYSIGEQLKKCRNKAEGDGDEVVAEFYDEYSSGKSIEYMKNFEKMLNELVDAGNPREIKKIYVWRIDRFGRNQSQMILSHDKIRAKGISLKTVDGNIDTATTTGKLFMGIMSSFAEWQREDIVSRTRAGWQEEYSKHPEKFGRPSTELNWKDVTDLLDVKKEDGKYKFSWSAIARIQNVSASTLLRRYKSKFGDVPKRRI